MDKLIIPAGCIIEGDAVSIINEGDIVIENDLNPQRIESVSGGIRYIPQNRKVVCQKLSAPRGRLEVQAESLSVQQIHADSINLDVNHLEVRDLLETQGTLQLNGQKIKLDQCHANEIEIRGEEVEGRSIHCKQTLILEGRQLKFEQIEAPQVIIRGNLTCKKLTAHEGVLVESGQVSIKYLDSPKFEAASEVRGIVVIATSDQVKAEGVRGFLHPDELNMLNDASPESIKTIDLPPIPEAPPAPKSPVEPEPAASAIPETEQPNRKVEDSKLTDPVNDYQTNDFQSEKQSMESKPEESLPDDTSASAFEPISPEEPMGEPLTDAPDPEPTIAEADFFPPRETTTDLEVPGFQAPLAELPQDSPQEDDPYGATPSDPDHKTTPDEEESSPIVSPSTAQDPRPEDADFSPLTMDNPFAEDAGEAPLSVEDSLSQDLDEPLLAVDEPLSELSENVEQSADQMENVVPFATTEDGPALEEVGQPDSDPYELQSAPQAAATFFGDEDSEEADSYLSPSGGDSETKESEYYLTSDLAESTDLESQYDIQHLANPIDEENDLYTATEEDFEDDSLPDIASIEDLDSAEDIEVNTSSFDDTMDEMEYPQMADDAHNEPEVLGEDDLYVMEEVPGDIDLSGDSEDVPHNEEDLVAMLTEILHQIRAYFPEDNYPNSINQIQRYLEEKRFTLFSKANNKNAVLSSFDKFDHPEISQLARSFFEKLEDFMARQSN